MPCFNEEAGLSKTIEAVYAKLSILIKDGKISPNSTMLFVDDGSTDSTWSIIEEAHALSEKVKGIKLAANRGKEYALFAGLMEARNIADIVVSMDADMQHDIESIDNFLEKRREGYELVYGVKASRGVESSLRKITAHAFYFLMSKLGSPVLPGHSDYCLASKMVLDALSEYQECYIMVRALLYQLGFKKCAVYFSVKDRSMGKSKMTIRNLVNLSLSAITSFSVFPLRVIALIGVMIFLISLLMICWCMYDFFVIGTPSGWATLICSLWFIGGLGMISLSIVGEYIGKIYMETKRRPRYYINQKIK